MSYIFTSESVSAGHPDKVCDQISDAVLDAYLAEDPNSRVACETMIKNNMVYIAGEITSLGSPDLEPVVRKTINDIGYNTGFSTIRITNKFNDIVDKYNEKEDIYKLNWQERKFKHCARRCGRDVTCQKVHVPINSNLGSKRFIGWEGPHNKRNLG